MGGPGGAETSAPWPPTATHGHTNTPRPPAPQHTPPASPAGTRTHTSMRGPAGTPAQVAAGGALWEADILALSSAPSSLGPVAFLTRLRNTQAKSFPATCSLVTLDEPPREAQGAWRPSRAGPTSASVQATPGLSFPSAWRPGARPLENTLPADTCQPSASRTWGWELAGVEQVVSNVGTQV